MDGLNLLDEARRENPEEALKTEHEVDQYKVLSIKSKNPATDIYLSDDKGNLVQQERGYTLASVAPGKYLVYFGLGTQPREINLVKDANVHE
jgi:hypothetical protein